MSTALTTRGSGSSPLTRGKQQSIDKLYNECGLIPAHAGKTEGGGLVNVASTAHPRSRGENVIVVRVLAALTGSSPLTRGKPCIGDRAGPCPGLIPAHAGKTSANWFQFSVVRAHPRSRGENNVAWHDPATPTGSSPLTRGKPVALLGARRPGGLIPAHAGKTDRLRG